MAQQLVGRVVCHAHIARVRTTFLALRVKLALTTRRTFQQALLCNPQKWDASIPRRQLIEIHEQPWCPVAIREGAMDCLKIVATVGRQYHRVLPKLQQALVLTGSTRIVDLCSGSGGPWPALHRYLQPVQGKPVQILLTDLFPTEQAMQRATLLSAGQLQPILIAVDATAIPAGLTGFRTLFTAFHHFPPEKAPAILQDAVTQRQGIAIFEQTKRTPLGIGTMLVLPWIAFLIIPFIRPWRLSRLFWTYLVPAIPLVLCFDGIVSCLRTYTETELQEMVANLSYSDHPPVDFTWEMGTMRSPLSPIGISYLIGYPVEDGEWGNGDWANGDSVIGN